MTNFEKSIYEVLTQLEMKKIEYTECSIESNINWEYFKGKKDAYEYSCNLIKRAMEWHNIKAPTQ